MWDDFIVTNQPTGKNGFVTLNDQPCGELTSLPTFVEYLRQYHDLALLPFLRGVNLMLLYAGLYNMELRCSVPQSYRVLKISKNYYITVFEFFSKLSTMHHMLTRTHRVCPTRRYQFNRSVRRASSRECVPTERRRKVQNSRDCTGTPT